MSNGETSLSKEEIVNSAVTRAVKGIEGANESLSTADVKRMIQGHWSKRYDDNEEDIKDRWDDLQDNALTKAERIGARSVALAEAEGASAISQDHFQEAITQINNETEKSQQSSWC